MLCKSVLKRLRVQRGKRLDIEEVTILTCDNCGLESAYLDEVCYYDINGFPHATEYDIEENAQNPDALAQKLCTVCAGKKFDK